jgi:hypothetical protein
MAASVVHDCSGRQENIYLPINSSNRVLEIIADEELHCKRATDEALKRLTHAHFRKGALLPKPGLSVPMVLRANAVLFAVEKQNLYIDDFRESRVWAKLLKNFAPTAQQLMILESWTLSGLRAANDTILGMQELGHPDGPLGWSSKPEFFLLIARVLACADVVLFWARKQRRESEVSNILMHFAINGEQNQVNEVLLTKAKSILQRNIMRTLQTTISRLRSIMASTVLHGGSPRHLEFRQ